MGRRDRWRALALIGGAATLVALPALAVPLLAAAFALSSRRRPPLVPGPAVATAVVLVAVALASGPTPADLWLAVGVGALAPLLALWSAYADAGDGPRVASGLAIGVAAHLVFAIAAGDVWPLAGATGHPNVLGALAAIALPVALVQAWVSRRGATVAAWAAVGAVALALVGSGSRGALIAALAGVAWLVATRARTPEEASVGLRPVRAPRRAPVVLLLAAAALVAGWWAVRQPSWTEAVSTTGRSALWGVALEGVLERPMLGHGPNAWSRVASAIEPSVDPRRFPHAHSGYLELALGFGSVGLAIVIAFGLALGRALHRAGSGPWRHASAASLLAFAVANVGDAFALDARFWGVLVVVAGAAWAHADRPVTPPAPTPPPPTA